MPRPPPTALVIDDDPAVRAVITLLLQHLKLDVVAVESGAAGVDAFLRHRKAVRVVFLDVQMPGLDGPATLQVLRLIDSVVPCYFVTAHAGEHSDGELIAAGANGILGKPIQLDDLERVVKTMNFWGADGPPA